MAMIAGAGPGDRPEANIPEGARVECRRVTSTLTAPEQSARGGLSSDRCERRR
jgi:hypothetical protein